ncbi:MAG: hypothetical protein JWQ62_810 [Lacunisphaera sp.]|nr:hypothetical protein [Lacunisphaera sp.]
MVMRKTVISHIAGAASARGSRFAPIIEEVPRPIVEVQGPAHTVTYVNPAFCELLGRKKAELIGKPFHEIVPGGRDCLPVLNRVYQTGAPTTHELEVRSEPQPSQWLYAMWPALDTGDRPVGVIIQLTKVTNLLQNAAAMNEALLVSALHQHELTAKAEELNARLAREIAGREVVEAALHRANNQLGIQAGQLEKVVAERTARLREMVGELEAFSYSIAHDMRAPLRGMAGFAQILLNDHANQLDATARDYLSRITRSAARMDLLIQGVLDYTRVSRSEAVLVPVDLDGLVRDLVATYPNWQPPHAEIKIEGPLPMVRGHPGLLTQSISNLVGNAMKFVAPGALPQIRIWAEELPATATLSASSPPGGDPPRTPGTTWVRIWFEDRGIGISAKDQGRIFQMFERLNPAAQFEGTGMGLTIVRKAVERMHGRTGFESDAYGSKFWIELEKAPRAESGGEQPAG